MAGDYGSIQARIADEVKRSDLTSQIALEIQSAIQFYEKEQFWFSQSRSTLTFSTVASQEFYTSSDNANIPYILELDAVTVTITGTRTPMEFDLSYIDMEAISSMTTSTGQPSNVAYYAQQLRFYPIPDAIYPVRVSGTFKLSTLSLSADTNAWMVEGEELIRSRAKSAIYSRYIRNMEYASQARLEEKDALQMLRETHSRKNGMGSITSNW